MYSFIALTLGLIAVANVAYLAYWIEKRIIFHVLPYVLVGASVVFFSLEFQKLDWIGIVISYCLIAGIHLVSFFSDSLKK